MYRLLFSAYIATQYSLCCMLSRDLYPESESHRLVFENGVTIAGMWNKSEEI